MKILFYLFFWLSVFSQSQEEILEDLDFKDKKIIQYKEAFEKLNALFKNSEDEQLISESEKLRLKFQNFKKAEYTEEELYILKIHRLRAESYLNLRQFPKALLDSKFIFENSPNLNVFDYTRYSVSLFHSKQKQKSAEILKAGKAKLRNLNDQSILEKTEKLLFPNN
jgi:hypothetical protein